MSRLFLFVMTALAAQITLCAQSIVKSESTTISPVQMSMTNTGIVGFDLSTSRAGTFWPRSSNGQFLFGGGVWIGGWVKQGTTSRPYVLSTYDPSSAVSQALPTNKIDRVIAGGRERLSTTFTYAATADPVGIRVSQTLETTDNGPLRDVALLHVMIENMSTNMAISQCAVGIVLDIEIGNAGSPMKAAQGDVLSLMTERPDLRILKAYNSQEYQVDNSGVLALASIGASGPSAFTSVTPFSLALVPMTDGDRYVAMTTGKIATSEVGSDLMVLASIEPQDLEPGGVRKATFALMFADNNSAESDARFIEVVDGLRRATTVHELRDASTKVSVYPNPTDGATRIMIDASTPWHEVRLIDLMGQAVRVSSFDPSGLDVAGLPSGSYIIQIHESGTVSTMPLQIRN
jgi:hypothetical protein